MYCISRERQQGRQGKGKGRRRQEAQRQSSGTLDPRPDAPYSARSNFPPRMPKRAGCDWLHLQSTHLPPTSGWRQHHCRRAQRRSRTQEYTSMGMSHIRGIGVHTYLPLRLLLTSRTYQLDTTLFWTVSSSRKPFSLPSSPHGCACSSLELEPLLTDSPGGTAVPRSGCQPSGAGAQSSDKRLFARTKNETCQPILHFIETASKQKTTL